MPHTPANTYLTVSKLNNLARTLLEDELGNVWVEAEISNFIRASSGHWYFTLKDAQAQIKSAMFRGNNRTVSPVPKDGDLVQVRGRVSLYAPRGDYQLVVEHMQSGGEGQLKQKFEQLKARLLADGLFDLAHKQALPANIQRVGVITSSSGAALHDIITVLRRRSPQTEVIIYPTQVQGEAATAQIVNAITIANQRQEVDVLIVGRGGGSLEDLWCFNEEAVARAIYHSQLPVISAVGHETDISISDLVADLRAPTPSAAAELVSSDQREHQARLQRLLQALSARMATQMRLAEHQLQLGQQRLSRLHPQYQLQQQSQRVDNLERRLHTAMSQQLQRANRRNDQARLALQQHSPGQRVTMATAELRNLQQGLQRSLLQTLDRSRQRLAENSHLLQTLSPLTTLSRGFSLSFTEQGELLKSPAMVKPGQQMITRLRDGEIISQVIESRDN